MIFVHTDISILTHQHLTATAWLRYLAVRRLERQGINVSGLPIKFGKDMYATAKTIRVLRCNEMVEQARNELGKLQARTNADWRQAYEEAWADHKAWCTDDAERVCQEKQKFLPAADRLRTQIHALYPDSELLATVQTEAIDLLSEAIDKVSQWRSPEQPESAGTWRSWPSWQKLQIRDAKRRLLDARKELALQEADLAEAQGVADAINGIVVPDDQPFP